MGYLQVSDSSPEEGKTLTVIFKHSPWPSDAWEVKGDAHSHGLLPPGIHWRTPVVDSTSSIPELPISFPLAPNAMPQQHHSYNSLSFPVITPGGIQNSCGCGTWGHELVVALEALGNGWTGAELRAFAILVIP